MLTWPTECKQMGANPSCSGAGFSRSEIVRMAYDSKILKSPVGEAKLTQFERKVMHAKNTPSIPDFGKIAGAFGEERFKSPASEEVNKQ